jgi:hypothetical protein
MRSKARLGKRAFIAVPVGLAAGFAIAFIRTLLTPDGGVPTLAIDPAVIALVVATVVISA